MSSDQIAFRLNDNEVVVSQVIPATTTLLHWLRTHAGLTGTKEGCNEGDCGACTIVLERPGQRTPLNACIITLGQLHGAAIRTVEGLGRPGAPHPIQTALAEADATQCGFCTPGFVMAAYAFATQRGDLHDALAGNLCRCTGYRPIVDALATLPTDDHPDPPPPPPPPPGPARFETETCTFHRPTTLDHLLHLRSAHPDATILAGGTDLGVALAEGQGPRHTICLLGIPELQTITTHHDRLTIGAAAPYADLIAAIEAAPHLRLAPLIPLLTRLGSRQIRGLGTLGGNLATASPIGDALPPLLALGATIRLRSTQRTRDLQVADFLLGYRRTALAAHEVIESITLPSVPPGALFACEKLSKRRDQDIAALSAAILLGIDQGHVRTAAIALGGMGPTAARAPAAEAALIGAEWSQPALDRAAEALSTDFAPLSDSRGSAAYRQQAAAGLLRRLWWRDHPTLDAL